MTNEQPNLFNTDDFKLKITKKKKKKEPEPEPIITLSDELTEHQKRVAEWLGKIGTEVTADSKPTPRSKWRRYK